METKIISISEITWLPKEFQPRGQINDEVVERYKDDMERGAMFPSPITYWDGETYHLADGGHRTKAKQALGLTKIEVEVRKGTRRDAILYAAGCNATHGLPRTNEDKRRAVTVLLSDPEWKQWSNQKIAEACAVSAPFVGKLRNESGATQNGSESGSEVRKFERNGQVHEMNTGNIGKRPRGSEAGTEEQGGETLPGSEAASAASAERPTDAGAPEPEPTAAAPTTATPPANDDTETPNGQQPKKPQKSTGFDPEKLYQQMIGDAEILKQVKRLVTKAEAAKRTKKGAGRKRKQSAATKKSPAVSVAPVNKQQPEPLPAPATATPINAIPSVSR